MAARQVKDVMTPDVEILEPQDTLMTAAEKMRSLNVGPLPVCENGKLVGILTDRDIVVRAVARGLVPGRTAVFQAMTEDVECVHEDDDLGLAARKMREAQVRRILVVNRDGRLVGILSLGDIAEHLGDPEAGRTLHAVSSPSEPAGGLAGP
jgi:CBS domain-containing protein